METKNDWQLMTLSINFNDWGKHKDTYTGAVKFRNGQEMDVNFMLNSEESRQFLSLVSDKIVEHATRMTQIMVSSMPLMLKENPEKPAEG